MSDTIPEARQRQANSLGHPALAVACPYGPCGATPLLWCGDFRGGAVRRLHKKRRDLWASLQPSPVIAQEPTDTNPVARLARTLAVHDAPAYRASDDVLAVVADPDGPARTGLTWGDLRALLDLTAPKETP